MRVERLALSHFRLYARRSFDFSAGMNTIEGPNARGKTSLLEALYLASVGSSFRSHHLTELIQRESSGFHLEVDYTSYGLQQQIRISCRPSERIATLNGIRLNTLNGLLGGLRTVIFTPEDRSLIKGAPQIRRHYLDLQISQVDPLYSHYLKRYQRAIKQRNCLLRSGRPTTLDSWEYELAQAAAYIIEKRILLAASLNQRFSQLYPNLTGSDSLFSLRYTHLPSMQEGNRAMREELFRKTWRDHRTRDSMAGMTLIGPHRDDLLLTLNGLEARHYASEGEIRSAAAVMRLAEWEEMALYCDGEVPVLLIDDFSLGLDSKRQHHFAHYLLSVGQVFITTVQSLSLPSPQLIHL